MQAINNRYGLDFTNYESSSLKRGIIRLMMKHKMESIIELWSKILKDAEFFAKAIDDLLVNLTELFRNPDVWLMLRNEIIPNYSSKGSLRIWHAGCSTGEEAYTMTFLLDELNLLNSARLTATDLSTTALNKAKEGRYPFWLINQYVVPLLNFFPNKAIDDYFETSDKHATVKPKYQTNITFQRHNLVTDPMSGQYDIIFCRNVMIYFDDNLKKRVLDLLNQHLKPNGFIIIGYYDILPDYGKTLFKPYDVKTRIYQKKQ